MVASQYILPNSMVLTILLCSTMPLILLLILLARFVLMLAAELGLDSIRLAGQLQLCGLHMLQSKARQIRYDTDKKTQQMNSNDKNEAENKGNGIKVNTFATFVIRGG